VMIATIRRDQFLDELLQVFDEAWLVLDGGERSGGAGHKDAYQSLANFTVLDLFAYFGSDIDDVAETGGLFGEFLGANGDHAIELSFASHSNGWRQ
jgi:hypothetical protein